MKSGADSQKASFSTMQARLLRLLTLRINSGEFTERGMARLIGVSQPQFHNVLKGKRKLQTSLADRIMQRFDLSILDLFHETELREQLIARAHTTTRVIGEHPASADGRSAPEPEMRSRKLVGSAAHHSSPQDLAG